MTDTDKYGMTNEELLERYSNLSVDDYKELLAEVKRLNHELTDAIDNMNWLDELAGRKEEEVKRLRLLFRELINDMNADDYIEWCNKIGCPDGLEVEAIKQYDSEAKKNDCN